MIKYKIVAVINFLLGIPMLVFTLLYSVYVIPKFSSLYANFSSQVIEKNINIAYISLFILFILSAMNVFLGYKGFSAKRDKDNVFRWGLIFILAGILAVGSLTKYLLLASIGPIYTMSSQL